MTGEPSTLPSGTVLFTDAQGSTRLLERRDRYAEALETHRGCSGTQLPAALAPAQQP